MSSTQTSYMAFLEQAGKGCISGRVTEWPQLVPACAWAVKEIAYLDEKYRQALKREADLRHSLKKK